VVQLTDITNLTNASGTAAQLNSNNDKIEQEFEKVVYKDGSKALTGDLDVNGQRFLNVPSPTKPTDVLRLADLQNTEWDGEAFQLRLDLGADSGSSIISYGPHLSVEDALRRNGRLIEEWNPTADGVTDDTAAITAAFDWAEANNGTLIFGDRKRYAVSQAAMVSVVGGNARSNIHIVGNGSTLVGLTAQPALRFFRTQGLIIEGLKVEKGPGATYATDFDSMWYLHASNCSFGDTRIGADDLWGFYWNKFETSDFGNIFFDLLEYTINHNLWSMCRVLNITKSVAGGTPKEAYNNVFYACDITGTLIDWRDTDTTFKQFPLVLDRCNIEADATLYGFIQQMGGLSIFPNGPTGMQSHYPWDDQRSPVDLWGAGGFRSTHWEPQTHLNIISGGNALTPIEGIAVVGIGSLNPVADATAPNPSGRCFFITGGGTNNALIRVTLPLAWLPIAKQLGYVGFSWWVQHGGPTTGGRTVRFDNGVATGTVGGMAYPTAGGEWVHRFVTVPLPPTATKVEIEIGGETAATADFRVTGVSAYLGRMARPWSPSSKDIQTITHTPIALPANGTDPATTQALVNAVKALLISKGLAS
jgi:hypothetical protein